jgi:hypothetical protein
MAIAHFWDGTAWKPISGGGGGGGVGPAGPPGADGANGVDGTDGKDGVDGADGESVTVFEQDTQPTALRTGDIWLEPTTLPVVAKDGLTLAEVEAVVADSLSKLPQPEPVVAPLGWQKLTGATAFGVTVNAFARAFSGSIHIRGTYTAQFGFLPAQKIADLPAGVPRPAFDYTVLVFGNEDGSTTPLPGKLTIKTNGELALDAPNCNTVIFDGISIPVE